MIIMMKMIGDILIIEIIGITSDYDDRDLHS